MKDDLLSQALAALQGNEAQPYPIKVGGMELSAEEPKTMLGCSKR